MPRAALVVWLLLALHQSVVGPLRADEAPDFAAAGVPFLKQHCVECHSGDKPKGELSLETFRDTASLVRGRKTWDAILKRIQTGDMPPEGRPRPTVAEADAFVGLVKGVFDDHDRHAPPDPGRVTMRRLNRVEYWNTVRDLLGTDFNPTEGFPADDIGHGFDNIGDVLTISPLLMERYLEAAETIAQRVILVDPPPPARRYLSGRFLQPNNAETPQGRFRPLDPKSEQAVHSGPFTADGGYLKITPDADLILRANLYAEPQGDAPVEVALFLIGQNLAAPASAEERARMLGANAAKLPPLQILKTFEITARDGSKPQEIEFPLHKLANINSAGVALLKPASGEPAKLFVEHIWTEGPLETRPASQQMILACPPDIAPAERTRIVLTRLLRRGYRRTPRVEEVARLTALVDATQAAGEKWEAGIQRAIEALLCSPKFLFRVELDDQPQSTSPPSQGGAGGGPQATPIDEFHLASRLSYFLWSTMPDDELLDLAEKKQLAANLDAQVKRMLAEPRSGELVRNFTLQWLQIQRLERFAPDAALFPTFDDQLRAAMLRETELFFDSIVREDRSILQLLDADYTFLNGPLAQHYGIVDTAGNAAGQNPPQPGGQPISGAEFRRVTLQGRRRGGLLTQASVLTVTSNPTRTSPVKRGRWVLEQILGEPPPPPPPDVPELPADEQAVKGGSLRQRLEVHRKNVTCANCHARMDPIGFALENFDAIGRYRTQDGEFPVDASGEFADGTKFAGPEDLKSIVAAKREQFARCLTEKLLTYALGRGVEYYDRRAVDKIVQELAAADYKFSALATGIARSDPFRMRRGIVLESK